MTIHIRCASSVDEFAAVATAAEHIAETTQYVHRLFENQCSRLSWCLIALREGVPVARLALWALPAQEGPRDFVLLNARWGTDPDGAQHLLRHIDALFIAANSDSIGHCQDTPPREPQWQTEMEARKQFLIAAGFHVARHTLRYRLPDATVAGQHDGRIRFEPTTEADEALLESLIARVAAASHDQLDREACAAYGADAHAKQLLMDLREMRVDDGWWQIAYAGEHPIGFILPTGSADLGTVGYVGVLPEHRGNGYVDALIGYASRTLQSAGFSRIAADTDFSNGPMAQAFERNGWQQFGERLEWTKSLKAN
jgi:RimJ/RimL family protein N-acetyltransferase